ncbi:MAG: hypothetical protein N3A66_05180 [Planctomycetota bacterium]|nr:hypothetical protein [Planctomycetota bacterium]
MTLKLRSRFLVWVFGGALAAGCGEQISAYRLIGHNPAAAKKILILPFLDTRTFKDPRDPHMDTAREKAREIFIAVMRKMPIFQDKEIIAPPADRECVSLSAGRAIALGKQHAADLVIAGQIFSFTETRAASIPPRAGLFVRIFSVADEQLVFVGDDYRAAAGPGARGGREAQLELAAQAILNEYAAINPPSRTARRMLKTEIASAADDAPKVLLLPFHERPNPDNLIAHTGGGEVVTGLFEMELAKDAAFRLIYLPAEAGGHDRLLTPQEALEAAKKLGAAYVIRGQVIEFRRAMSVPSWYSAIISVAILAAQVMFAELSGVDIATEVWRVAGRACVFARRDTEIQKYVVQAEKTVRNIAAVTVPLMKKAMADKEAPAVSPLIDTIILKPRVSPRTAAREEAEEERKPKPSAPSDENKEEGKKAEPPAEKQEAPPAAPAEKKSEEKATTSEGMPPASTAANDKPAEKQEPPADEKKPEDPKPETPAAAAESGAKASSDLPGNAADSEKAKQEKENPSAK